jgi:predicted nucleic-acid-binding protein
MIAVDTNVLLRATTSDDVVRTCRARAILEEAETTGERVHVNLIVLIESVWVLSRSRKLPRETIADWVHSLLSTKCIHVDDEHLVADALSRFRTSRVGFADILIGSLNRRAGCRTTYSFDRLAGELETFTPVPGGGAQPPTLASTSARRKRSITSMNATEGTSRMSAVIAAIW